MNYRITTALILALSITSLASPALAQDVSIDVYSSASGTPVQVNERREKVEERRTERKANVETRKASTTARRVEMQRGLAKKKAEHTSRVLTATVERLEKILVRLESRIEKVKANGGATAESESYVAEARGRLSAAKASIALLASVDLSGDKAQENFEEVKEIASQAKERIREAHTSLMNALRSLGKVRGGTNATSTATSTAQ